MVGGAVPELGVPGLSPDNLTNLFGPRSGRELQQAPSYPHNKKSIEGVYTERRLSEWCSWAVSSGRRNAAGESDRHSGPGAGITEPGCSPAPLTFLLSCSSPPEEPSSFLEAGAILREASWHPQVPSTSPEWSVLSPHWLPLHLPTPCAPLWSLLCVHPRTSRITLGIKPQSHLGSASVDCYPLVLLKREKEVANVQDGAHRPAAMPPEPAGPPVLRGPVAASGHAWLPAQVQIP